MDLSGWLGGLFRPASAPDDAAVAGCVEEAVDLIEPKLRLAAGYARRLHAPVARLLAHAEDFATRVPGPVELSRRSFGADPLVHALFGSADDLPRTLALSVAVRDYLARAPAASGELFALMGVRRAEKSILGVELQGEVIRRDVPQVAVYFRDHTLTGPAASEALARRFLARSAFESVVLRAADELAELRQRRATLEAEGSMLRARRRSAPEDAALHAKCAGNEAALGAARSALQWPAVLARAVALIADPARHLRLEDVALTLSRMGIRGSSASSEPMDTIRFPELVGRDRRRWVVLLVRVPAEELSAAAARVDAAQRWITI